MFITLKTLENLAFTVANKIQKQCEGLPNHEVIKAYGVPRGGVVAALAIQRFMPNLVLVDEAEKADIYIDDIIDSGRTMHQMFQKYGAKPFFALIDKTIDRDYDNWIVFPWEETEETSIEDNVVRMIQYAGEDPAREGLLDTPKRVSKAWREWFRGYLMDAKELLKVFEDGAENYNQMITVKDIPFYSHCEHHLAPFFGTVTISYIPDGKIVGLSKLNRLADMFARRMQVQERLTNQIADAVDEHLTPKGVGVLIRARHMCMESRGVCQQGHHTVTTALRGAIYNLPEVREEFLRNA